MPSIPSEFTVTCDICSIEAMSPTPVPTNWAQVPGPSRVEGNPNMARPAYLCPDHKTAYVTFWTPRQPGTTVTIA